MQCLWLVKRMQPNQLHFKVTVSLFMNHELGPEPMGFFFLGGGGGGGGGGQGTRLYLRLRDPCARLRAPYT